jgi:mono/diheme cytochrome c family protein
MRGRSRIPALIVAALCSAAGSGGWGHAEPSPPGHDQDRLGTESGFGIFQQRCTRCHGNPAAPERASAPSTLRQLAPEAIYNALTTGAMKVQGQSLSDE